MGQHPQCRRPGVHPPLSEVFDGPVSERLVDNGHRVHDPEPYLNNPTTGEAVSRLLAG